MSASATQQSTSRARTQGRKKINDDAAYFGPSSAAAGSTATKRQAADKADGEPRMKRKKVDVAQGNATSNSKRDVVEAEPRKSLVEFHKMPVHVLQRYLIQFDIVPRVYPSPLTPEDPPAPSSLTDPLYQSSRPPSPPTQTPANRPRREPKEAQNRRRSSRLLEEEIRTRAPILADKVELHGVLASTVEKHFRETTAINGREEVDMLAAFMCAVEKAKDGKCKGSS